MDAPVKVIDGAQYRRHGEFVAIGPRRLLADALTGAPVLAAHIAQARSETTTSYLAAEARARAEENELSRDAQ